MATFIIVLIVIGLIAGLIARLLLPGRDPIGIVGTIVLGILGSFIGGFLPCAATRSDGGPWVTTAGPADVSAPASQLFGYLGAGPAS